MNVFFKSPSLCMTNEICKTIVAALLFCGSVMALTACTTEDDIGNPTASVVIPLNADGISQAVAE